MGVIGAVAVCAMWRPAEAVVTFFDSLAAWNAATAGQEVRVTFEEAVWPVNQILTGAWTVNGVMFQGFAGTPQPNIYVANFGSPFGTGNWLTANGDENIDITFGPPRTGLAFDAASNQFGSAFIRLFDETGGEIGALTIPTNVVRYVGITSDIPIRRVNFSSVLGAIANTGFDTVRSGSMLAPCLCDADGDRDIDFADITSVLASFNAVYAAPGGPGDADKNGTVEFADITCVLASFGLVCP